MSQLTAKDRVHTQYYKYFMSTSITPHTGRNNSHVPATQIGRGEPLEHEHIQSGICAEDDSPLHEQGGEELYDLPCGESREEKVEVHVLKKRVPMGRLKVRVSIQDPRAYERKECCTSFLNKISLLHSCWL